MSTPPGQQKEPSAVTYDQMLSTREQDQAEVTLDRQARASHSHIVGSGAGMVRGVGVRDPWRPGRWDTGETGGGVRGGAGRGTVR